jgi:hypothetical protein
MTGHVPNRTGKRPGSSRKKKMKVFLLQLPLQGHDFFFSHENIPLASAYLLEIAAQQGMDAVLVPSLLMSYGSDQAILHFLLDAQTDLVGMSCYQWNLERSLFLAKQLKRYLPSCTIVMGGPEISPDNKFLLRHKDFDIGVVGEGEETWKSLLQSFPHIPDVQGLLLPKEDGQWHFSGNRLPRSPLGHCPSPFLSSALDSHLKGVLWLETVRGCVYRCAYCCYHKQFLRLRTFPLERILKEVSRARDQGLREIVFLDPCFSRRPRLEALLDGLATINHDRRLRLYAECNVEAIDPRIAEKMAKAGFVEMEVGLQSVKRKTLRNIHRIFHPQRFLQGVRSLQGAGVEVMVDLIAGLPGDDLSDIRRSVDWVMEQDAYDSLMLYPLSVMPGTELHRRADEFRLCAMPNPPYLVTRNQGLTAPEMSQAFRYYEERLEEDINPFEMPLALNSKPEASPIFRGLCTQVNWHTDEQIRNLPDSAKRTAYAFTVSLTGEILRQPRLWLPVLQDYLEKNPFTLLSIEVPPEVFPEDLQPLWRLAQGVEHPVDRDYTVTHTPYRRFLIFSRAQGLVWKWPDPREFNPLILHDGQKIPSHPVCLVKTPDETIPEWFVEYIHRRYPSPPEIKPWQLPDDESH